MPKASSSLSTNCCNCVVLKILLLGKAMPSYSRCADKKLVYIIITALSGCQLFSCAKYTKLNIRSSCDVKLVSNAKYTRSITLNSVLVP